MFSPLSLFGRLVVMGVVLLAAAPAWASPKVHTRKSSASDTRKPATHHADKGDPAARAYARGLAAYKRSDYTAAATSFNKADSLRPNALALAAALDAAVIADDSELGAILLSRAVTRKSEEPLATMLARACDRFGTRIVQDLQQRCTAATDKPAKVDEPVMTSAPSKEETKPLTKTDAAPASPRATHAAPSLAFATTAPPRETRHSDAGLVPRPLFYTAVGLTAAAGAMSVAFAVDSATSKSKADAAGCDSHPSTLCESLKTSDLGLKVSLGATAGFAASSVILGILAYKRSIPVEVGVAPGVASMKVQGTF